MTTTRTDLLSLTEDALAALANRGLVKRAAKELAAGTGATLTITDDGGIEATFPDGTRTHLPPGTPLSAATCTCAASAQCRHRIGLVLAYQSTHSQEENSSTWSPADIPDETLTRVLGARAVDAARHRLTSGFEAVVHRGISTAAAPHVELPTCTVTFHVAGDPSYATTDAAEAKRAEAIVLAVWAFRAAPADENHVDGIHVRVGGTPQSPNTLDLTPLDRAAEVIENLLLDGTAHAGPLSLSGLRHAVRDLTDASMLWPAAVAEDLANQVEWYAQRNARYEMRRAAELITEFQSRRRAAHTSSTPASAILGTTEPQTTELRRVRLVGLGCRVEGGTTSRMAELYFAHPQDGAVLVLRTSWESDSEPLRTRRIARFPLYQLAAANLISDAATRSASRVITLGSSNVAKTSVLPVGRSWLDLPERLLIRDFKALVERISARGPRALRPRVVAEDVFVFVIDTIEAIGYDPAQQRLEAVVRDEQGTQAVLRAEYSPHAPAALNALATELTTDRSERLLLSANVTIESGQAILHPIALSPSTGDTIRVPDLEPGDGSTALPVPPTSHHEHANPIAGILNQTADTLAEHAHRGLALLTAPAHAATKRLAHDLRRTGLIALAALLDDYAQALATEDRAAQLRTWTDAFIAAEACHSAI